MKKLIIIGDFPYYEEVLNIFENSNQCNEYSFEKFVRVTEFDEVGSVEVFPGVFMPELPIGKDNYISIALDDIELKAKVIRYLRSIDSHFVTLVAKNALIFKDVEIGEGCIIGPNVVISFNSKLKNFVHLQNNITIGNNVTISDYCHINANVFIGQNSSVGESVTIHAGCICIPNIVIGKNAVLGIGSVNLRNVKSGVTMFGNPAIEIL